MTALRELIRRWLGVPTEAAIRNMILREIDADTVWRTGDISSQTFPRRRRDLTQERAVAVALGYREDTDA